MVDFKRTLQNLQDIDLSWLRSLSYLWLVPPALLIAGLQGLHTAVRYPEPSTYTVREYLDHRPTDKWLILTDADVVLASATYIKVPLIGIVTDLYFPVAASEDSQEHCLPNEPSSCTARHTHPPFQLLVTTTNRRIINQVHTAQTQPQANHNFPKELGTVSGMAKFGIEGLTSDRRRWLEENYGDRLADDIVVIDLNAQPKIGRSVAFLIGGVATGSWLLKPRLLKE